MTHYIFLETILPKKKSGEGKKKQENKTIVSR